jgi:hypothetical protein
VEEWFQEERLKKSDKRDTLEMCCMSEVTDCVGDARTFGSGRLLQLENCKGVDGGGVSRITSTRVIEELAC